MLALLADRGGRQARGGRAAHLNAALAARAPAGGRPSQPQRFYVEQLATMKERELKCLYVNFEHVAEYDQVRAAASGRSCSCCLFFQAAVGACQPVAV